MLCKLSGPENRNVNNKHAKQIHAIHTCIRSFLEKLQKIAYTFKSIVNISIACLGDKIYKRLFRKSMQLFQKSMPFF